MWRNRKIQILGILYVFLLLYIGYLAFWRKEAPEASVILAPKVALTFDDGPSAEYTPILLDGLKQRGVKATFFLIGENIEKEENAVLVRRMAEEGHLLGNHTYHHVELTRLERMEALKELEMTNELIGRITGNTVQFVRPPFGEWPEELEEEMSMIPVMWSVDPRDWYEKDADEIVRKVVTQTEENDMILLHDCYGTSVEAALRIVDLLKEKGYEFVTADQLLMP